MEKTRSRTRVLGVQKNETKRKGKKLINKIIDYLKSDTYLFAPLVASPPFDFRVPETNWSSSSGFKLNGQSSRRKKKRVWERIGDFLKSDSFMYGEILAPQEFEFTPKGKSTYVKKVNMEVLLPKTVMRQDELLSSSQVLNDLAKDQTPTPTPTPTPTLKKNRPSTPAPQNSSNNEVVKHVLYRTRATRSSSEKGTRKAKPRQPALT